MNTIRRVSLDIFCSRDPGTVRGNIAMLRNMVMTAKEDLELEYWFLPLGPYSLKYEMGVQLACVTLSFSLINGRYVGNLKRYSTRKSPEAWANLYEDVVLEMGNIIFEKGWGKVHGDIVTYSGDVV